MRSCSIEKINQNKGARRFFIRLGLVLLIFLSGCDMFITESDPSLEETQIEISLQQTLLAQQSTSDIGATLEAQSITLEAQAALATQRPQPGESATFTPTLELPIQIQETILPSQETTQISAPPTSESTDWVEKMKSAQILLYEDMVAYLDTPRYVKETLDSMGLSYDDIGSAKGWLQDRLTTGPTTGGTWDLVIIAAEAKKQSVLQGEYFTMIMNAIDQGSSVILEAWFLNKIYSGEAASLLEQCGVAFQDDWQYIPPNRLVLFPLISHPILQEPNNDISFTKTTSYWWDIDKYSDMGDLLKISGTGDAQLLAGTTASATTGYGALTVCMQGKLILQTFSSHGLTFTSMKPVWENYIYNALKARFTASN